MLSFSLPQAVLLCHAGNRAAQVLSFSKMVAVLILKSAEAILFLFMASGGERRPDARSGLRIRLPHLASGTSSCT